MRHRAIAVHTKAVVVPCVSRPIRTGDPTGVQTSSDARAIWRFHLPCRALKIALVRSTRTRQTSSNRNVVHHLQLHSTQCSLIVSEGKSASSACVLLAAAASHLDPGWRGR